ncbi:MAG TPA: hypothetical protein DEH78_12750 [Solibacterales bacterium]|nr:hypothetical protein [Bryobacterales bacterium]
MFLAVLSCALPAAAQRGGGRLPEPLVEGYTAYLGALLGLSFSPEERAEIRRHVDGYWNAGDRESMGTVKQAASTWEQVRQQDPELVAAAMAMSRASTLLSVQKAADGGREDSRYLLGLYYRANPVLAPGKPGGLPLTRDMVEAELALKHWMATQIHRHAAPVPDARVVDASVKTAVRTHPTLTAEQQVQAAQTAGEWARIRYGWRRASTLDRLIAINDMGGRLTPQEQAAVQQAMAGMTAQLNGMAAQHRDAMFSGAMQSMRQNSETIMGRGTVWNPATNRWEQQGGIVTEFNGTVRMP